MDIASRPVIAFTTSDMPNWNRTVCDNIRKRRGMTADEESVLKAYDSGKNVKKVAALSKLEISDNYAAVLDMFQSYRTSGMIDNVQ